MSKYITPLSNMGSGYIGDKSRWVEFFKFLSTLPELSEIALDALVAIEAGHSQNGSDFSLEFGKKFGLKCPPSYADFMASGGAEFYFLMYVKRGVNHRRPGEILQAYYDISKIGYFKDLKEALYRDIVDGVDDLDNSIFDEYYTYQRYVDGKDEAWRVNNFKSSDQAIRYLEFCLIIGRHFSPEIMMLNVKEVTKDGEMEAFLFDSVDCIRYRSFAEIFVSDLIGLVRSIGKRDGGRRNTLDDFRYIGADLILDLDFLSKGTRSVEN